MSAYDDLIASKELTHDEIMRALIARETGLPMVMQQPPPPTFGVSLPKIDATGNTLSPAPATYSEFGGWGTPRLNLDFGVTPTMLSSEQQLLALQKLLSPDTTLPSARVGSGGGMVKAPENARSIELQKQIDAIVARNTNTSRPVLETPQLEALAKQLMAENPRPKKSNIDYNNLMLKVGLQTLGNYRKPGANFFTAAAEQLPLAERQAELGYQQSLEARKEAIAQGLQLLELRAKDIGARNTETLAGYTDAQAKNAFAVGAAEKALTAAGQDYATRAHMYGADRQAASSAAATAEQARGHNMNYELEQRKINENNPAFKALQEIRVAKQLEAMPPEFQKLYRDIVLKNRDKQATPIYNEHAAARAETQVNAVDWSLKFGSSAAAKQAEEAAKARVIATIANDPTKAGSAIEAMTALAQQYRESGGK